MARLADLEAPMRDALLGLECAPYENPRFLEGPPLSERRVAIISTAGLHTRGDRPFGVGAGDYRVIPGDAVSGDLVMSHISSNFDRSGYREDWNLVFPIDRLREMAAARTIDSVADYHYSFMGATDPNKMRPAAVELAEQLRGDGVNALLLVPV